MARICLYTSWNKYNQLGLSGKCYEKYSKGEDIVITTETLTQMAKKAELTIKD